MRTPMKSSPIPTNNSDFACVDFVNSAFTDHLGRGASIDRLTSPEWRRWFLDRYGLIPDDFDRPPLDRLVVLRRDVRRVLEKWSLNIALNRRDLRILDGHLGGAPVRMRVSHTAAGLALGQEPLERSWKWVIASVAASAVKLVEEADPGRLKTCDNPDCSWIFLDTSVNRSKRFCSATPCGTLTRVRRFRERR